MSVLMMNIRKMRMFVGHFEMYVSVSMRLLPIPRKVVDMLMMNIMRVTVFMI